MKINKITPNLYADAIEPCVRFWVDRLGFEKMMDVPDGDKLAFAILKKGEFELMYGTYASLERDLHVAKLDLMGPSFLFVEVENLDDFVKATHGADVIMDIHTTFYGSKEISVKDPAGHVITFAQFGAAAAQ
jgi:uncharacterized glyoxalase superfamily protein PhnB